MLDRCVDAAVRKIFRVSSSDNFVFIRTCLGLYHMEDFVRKRTVKFMNNLVTKQSPTADHSFIVFGYCLAVFITGYRTGYSISRFPDID